MNKYDRKRNPIKKKAKNEEKENQEEVSTWTCENCGEKILTSRDKCWKCQKSQSKIRTEAKPMKPIDRIYYHSDLYEDAFEMDINDIIDSIATDSERSINRNQRAEYFNYEGNMVHQNNPNNTHTNDSNNNSSNGNDNQNYLDAVLERLGMLSVPCYVGLTWEKEGRKIREAKIREARKKRREDEIERSKIGKIKFEDVKQKKGKYRPSDLSRPDVHDDRDEELIHLSDEEFSDEEQYTSGAGRRGGQEHNDDEQGKGGGGREVCPGCGQVFPSSWSNEAVNEHIDDCVLSPGNKGVRRNEPQQDRNNHGNNKAGNSGNGGRGGDYYSGDERDYDDYDSEEEEDRDRGDRYDDYGDY